MPEIFGPEGVNFYGKRGVNAADPVHDKDVVNFRTLQWYLETAEFSAITASGGSSFVQIGNQGGGVPVYYGISGNTQIFNSFSAGTNLGVLPGAAITYYLQPNISVSGLTAQTVTIPPFSASCNDIVTLDCNGNLAHSAGTTVLFASLSAGTSTEIISGNPKVTIRHTLWETGRTSAGGSYSSYFMPVQLQKGGNISNSNWSLVAGSGNTIKSGSNFSTILNGNQNSAITSLYSTITNGYRNIISGAPYSSILNGSNNKIYKSHSTITGGKNITIGLSAYTTAVPYLRIANIYQGPTTPFQFLTIDGNGYVYKTGITLNVISALTFSNLGNAGSPSGNVYSYQNLGTVFLRNLSGGSNIGLSQSNNYISIAVTGLTAPNISAGTATQIISGNTLNDPFTIRHTIWESGRTSTGAYTTANMAAQMQKGDNQASANFALVAGKSNSGLSQYSTIIGGKRNTILSSSPYSFIGAGSGNSVYGSQSLIGSGRINLISGSSSSILNGQNNNTYSSYSTILNGSGNTIFRVNINSSIIGGTGNQISGFSVSNLFGLVGQGVRNYIHPVRTVGGTSNYHTPYVTILNGLQNINKGKFSTIVNGKDNWIEPSGYNSFQSLRGYVTILGGSGNTASTRHVVIGAGVSNRAGIASFQNLVGYNIIMNGYSNYARLKFGSIFNGFKNSATTQYSTVINGKSNKASGLYATVFNGIGNLAQADGSWIGNGRENTATTAAISSVIVGGNYNFTNSRRNFIGNGNFNTAGTNWYATVLNGSGNSTFGKFSTILNGFQNNTTASSPYQLIGNGSGNTIAGGKLSSIINGKLNSINISYYSSIVGGKQNSITSFNHNSFIGGGSGNTAASIYSVIVNGISNYSTYKKHQFIGNGRNNTARGGHATIVNGFKNQTAGITAYHYSFIGNGAYNSINAYDNNSWFSAILQGSGNTTKGPFNVITNGQNNSAFTSNANYGWSFIGNGKNNFLNFGKFNFIGTGKFNTGTNNFYSTILNGRYNYIGNGRIFSSILNGSGNTIKGNYSTISNGKGNIIDSNANYSSIIGGKDNNIGPSVSNAVILGSTGLALTVPSLSSTASDSNHTYVDYLKIRNAPNGGTKFLTIDSNGYVYSTGTTGGGGTGGSGTSGSSGANGTSGSSGSGTSGSSGANGTSGSSGSGTSGSSGANGTSGSSGSGTSGSSGANGTSGSRGTSGSSGSGTSGSSGANGTSGSSGANGTSGSSGTSPVVDISTFIASNSSYIETAASGDIYIGNTDSGWNGAPWNNLIGSGIGANSVNCGIPITSNIPIGATITCCGIAYNSGGATSLQGALSGFKCNTYGDPYDWSSRSSVTNFDGNGVACFSFGYVTTAAMTACEDYIVVGLGVSGANSKLEFSFTLSWIVK